VEAQLGEIKGLRAEGRTPGTQLTRRHLPASRANATPPIQQPTTNPPRASNNFLPQRRPAGNNIPSGDGPTTCARAHQHPLMWSWSASLQQRPKCFSRRPAGLPPRSDNGPTRAPVLPNGPLQHRSAWLTTPCGLHRAAPNNDGQRTLAPGPGPAAPHNNSSCGLCFFLSLRRAGTFFL